KRKRRATPCRRQSIPNLRAWLAGRQRRRHRDSRRRYPPPVSCRDRQEDPGPGQKTRRAKEGQGRRASYDSIVQYGLPPIAATCLLLLVSGVFAQTPAVDWSKQQPEILKHYRSLIQIDTSNPPGNETTAADYIKKVFEAEGIATKTFALEPSRGNIVAR